jgi:lysyl-tRNA synthetase class 2
MFHQTSPEYALKKLLAAGMPDCFALGHVFRDGEVSPLHNPEFTLLEWYRRGADYTALMDDTARLCADLAIELRGSPIIDVGGKPVDLTPPWECITVANAMQRWAGVDIEAHTEDATFREEARNATFRAAARNAGHDWVTNESWDDLFYKLFLTHVEPHLGAPKPVILCEYPVRFGALARRHPERPHVAERFEAYVAGVELCNAFSELADPVEQRERLEAEQRQRAALGAEVLPVDEDFLDALGGGFPVCAGNALGVDRLVMLLAGETDIARVTWFPFSVMAGWAERHRPPLS